MRRRSLGLHRSVQLHLISSVKQRVVTCLVPLHLTVTEEKIKKKQSLVPGFQGILIFLNSFFILFFFNLGLFIFLFFFAKLLPAL